MGRFPTFSRLPATLSFILVLALVHEIAWAIGGREAVSAMGSAVCHAQGFSPRGWWALVASGFVHEGWQHLLANVEAILVFGLWLEPRFGTRRSAALIFTSILAGSVFSLLLERTGSCGASSVALAFGGALISRPFWTADDGSRRYSGLWLLFLYLVVTFYTGDRDAPLVSHAGHLGGLLTGLWFGATSWREDPANVAPGTRLRYAGAIALITVALAGAEAELPRWIVLRNWKEARMAEDRGDLALAEKRWWTVVEWTDPASDFDAVYIDAAARFWLRRHEDRHALDLLCTIARTADTPKIHRDIGFIRARLDPPDMPGALDAWRKSYHTAPEQADVLDAMAQAKIFTDDTLLYRPEQAVDLARRAVYADGMENAWYVKTLADALFEVDEYDQAIGWMRRARARAAAQGDTLAQEAVASDLDSMRRWRKENPPMRTSAAQGA